MRKYNPIYLGEIFLLTSVFVLFIQLPLFAQLPTPTRGSTADIEEKAATEEKPYKAFKPKPKAEVEKEPEEKGGLPADAEKKFFVKKIKVVGNTILPPKEIDNIVKGYENKELSLNDLMELANKITALYASKGHITSQAYVPPQRIEEETVTIEVIEGQYGEFDIQGSKYTRKCIVSNRLKRRHGDVFNYNKFRKDLLYLNENPDRTVRAAMLRGKQPKTTDFKVTVKDRPPIHLGYELNNRGNKSTGLWRHMYTLKDTGLFLYDDNMNLRYIHSEQSNLYGVSADYTIPVNEVGTKLGASYSHFRVNVGHDYDELDIKSRSTAYSFFMEHPIFDFDFLSGKLEAGLDIKEARTEMLAIRQSRDRLRILRTGLTLEENDAWGRSVLENELSYAPHNFLGSCANITHVNDPSRPHSLGPSRVQADGTLTKYNYRFSRLNRLPFSSVLLLNAQGQAANNLLYGSEQHRIGGAYSVRGFAEGEALGDYGANASAEVRFPFYLIPEDFYVWGINPRRTIQGAGFIDWGFVHAKSPVTTIQRPERHNDRLVGAGFGLRLNLVNCVSGTADLAWPISGKSDYGKEPRLHMALSIEEPTLQQYEAMLEEMTQHRVRRQLNLISKKVPPDMVDMYEKALALEKEGHCGEAKELYVAVINRKNEILADAKAKISEAIQKEEDIKSMMEEAEKFHKEGKYSQAKALYEKILLMKKTEK